MLKVSDIQSINIEGMCRYWGFKELPCEHRVTLILSDERTASGLSCFEISVLVASLAEEKINPTNSWSVDGVKEHFLSDSYKTSLTVEGILNKLFPAVTITINDVEKIVVDQPCVDTWPCSHFATVTLKDGSTASGLTGFEICAIISNLEKERINPNSPWVGLEIHEHFEDFKEEDDDEVGRVEPPEVVLSRLFSQKIFSN